MKMKNGTASRTPFDMTPKTRSGNAYRRFQEKSPSSMPMTAKMRAVPPSENATG